MAGYGSLVSPPFTVSGLNAPEIEPFDDYGGSPDYHRMEQERRR